MSISIMALSSLSPVSRPGHQNIETKFFHLSLSGPAFFTIWGRSASEDRIPDSTDPDIGDAQVQTLSASLLSSPSCHEAMRTSKCKGITPNDCSVLLLLSRFRGASSSSSSSSWNEWKLISWSSKSHQIMEATKVLPFWEVPCLLLLRAPISFLFLLSAKACESQAVRHSKHVTESERQHCVPPSPLPPSPCPWFYPSTLPSPCPWPFPCHSLFPSSGLSPCPDRPIHWSVRSTRPAKGMTS